MARFEFCLIGTSQRPVLEIDARDVGDLHDAMARARFIEGRMVQIEGEPLDCRVLIATHRIQMVLELPEW